MVQKVGVKTPGDLEAVILAETYDLLGSIVGPYMYEVSGAPGQQQALFSSSEVQALFYIRVHEFLAEATELPSVSPMPGALSLFKGGNWLCQLYPGEARDAGLDQAYRLAEDWLIRPHRIVFWSPSVWRHVRMELPLATMIAMRANLEKHQLLRLAREMHRLSSPI